MSRKILIIQGHPDADERHFGHGLADAYGEAAREAGHRVDEIRVASLQFPFLAGVEDFEQGEPPADIRRAQQAIEAADHVLFFYPLWLGDMPAMLKAFLEQVFRPAFVADDGMGGFGKRRLKGRSARLVVTMGMPALFYRLFYRAHSVHSFRRNILRFCGFRPVRATLFGLVAGDARRRERALARMRRLGGTGT